MTNSMQGLEKKQKLLLEYFHLIAKLREEKSAVSAKISKAEKRFEELLNADADPSQLKLFDDLDGYLTEKAA